MTLEGDEKENKIAVKEEPKEKKDDDKEWGVAPKKKRVGIIGFGHLGQFLKIELSKSQDFCLKRIWNRTPDKEEDVLPLSDLTPSNLSDIDLVVEVAHPDVVKNFAEMILEHVDLFVGSQTAFADKTTFDTINDVLKKRPNRRVFTPSGTLWGCHDIRRMADLGIIKALTLTIVRHPNAIVVSGPLKELNDSAKRTNTTISVFDGPPRLLFPYLEPNSIKNMVVNCAVSAHPFGFNNMRIRLIADPEMANWQIAEYEILSENGSKTIVRRQNPSNATTFVEAPYFSFLSSLKESLYKSPGFNIC